MVLASMIAEEISALGWRPKTSVLSLRGRDLMYSREDSQVG